jgi:hypothetical protein
MRPRDARDNWERGSARCQMQNLATGKFHRYQKSPMGKTAPNRDEPDRFIRSADRRARAAMVARLGRAPLRF